MVRRAAGLACERIPRTMFLQPGAASELAQLAAPGTPVPFLRIFQVFLNVQSRVNASCFAPLFLESVGGNRQRVF